MDLNSQPFAVKISTCFTTELPVHSWLCKLGQQVHTIITWPAMSLKQMKMAMTSIKLQLQLQLQPTRVTAMITTTTTPPPTPPPATQHDDKEG